MPNKPIFVATHPRSCSTAFERVIEPSPQTFVLELTLLQVFMTRRDALQCVHEPFGDAFYYGPERLSSRYEKDEKARLHSNFAQSTFRTVLDRIEKEGAEVRITLPSVACLLQHPSSLHSVASKMWCFHATVLEVFGSPSVLAIQASASAHFAPPSNPLIWIGFLYVTR